MSGLCGILPVNCDRDRDLPALDRGLHAIAHRGRDSLSCYHDEYILLGHALFDTGCNGFALDDDGFAIAFDGRLDNGDALRAKLRDSVGHHSPLLDRLPDTRLILAAYRAFGPEVAAMMRGDFAIAIWDPVERRAYLARDQVGVKPLFYRRVGDDLLFASEIKALLAMRVDVPAVRREEALAAFVDGVLDEGDAERQRTFYDDVYRLLPGHFALATRGGFETKCYWRLDPGLPTPRDDAGAEFRALFVQALNRRLRGNFPVGSFLSGGLDSSSIVSTLAVERTGGQDSVHAFSMTFSDPDIEDERDYFRAVVEQYDVDHHVVDCTAASGLADIDEILFEQDQPPFGPNGSIFRHFLHEVHDRHAGRIILHGHGGDEVVSDGAGLFGELASSGHLIRLWRELSAVRDITGPPWPHFRRLVWRRGIRRGIGKLLHWPTRILRHGQARSRDAVTTAPDGRERPVEQASHLRKLTAALFSQALEITDIDAAFAGVELRMPFLDVDLMEFCVTTEASDKWKDGLPRSLIRSAMRGILPEKIRLRTDKHDFAANLRRSLLRHDRDVIDEAILQRADRILPYCNLAQIRADWSDLRTTGELDTAALTRLWRIVILSRWLDLPPMPVDEYLEAAQ